MEIAVSSRMNHVSNDHNEPPTLHIMRNYAMSKALQQLSFSLFFKEIENSYLPQLFVKPTFIMYDCKSNTIEHVSHYNWSIAIYSKIKALMCKIFLSNLEPMVMRWFDGLEKRSIHGLENRSIHATKSQSRLIP